MTGAADATAARAASAATPGRRVRVISHPRNRGYGAALRTGFRRGNVRRGLPHGQRRTVRSHRDLATARALRTRQGRLRLPHPAQRHVAAPPVSQRVLRPRATALRARRFAMSTARSSCFLARSVRVCTPTERSSAPSCWCARGGAATSSWTSACITTRARPVARPAPTCASCCARFASSGSCAPIRRCSTGSIRPRERRPSASSWGPPLAAVARLAPALARRVRRTCWSSTSRGCRCSPGCTITWPRGTRSAICRSPPTDIRRTSATSTRSCPGFRCSCTASCVITRDDVTAAWLVNAVAETVALWYLVAAGARGARPGVGDVLRCGWSRSRRPRSSSSRRSAKARSSRLPRRACTTRAPVSRARRSSPARSRARSGSRVWRSSPRSPSSSCGAAGGVRVRICSSCSRCCCRSRSTPLYMQIHIGDARALLDADKLAVLRPPAHAAMDGVRRDLAHAHQRHRRRDALDLRARGRLRTARAPALLRDVGFVTDPPILRPVLHHRVVDDRFAAVLALAAALHPRAVPGGDPRLRSHRAFPARAAGDPGGERRADVRGDVDLRPGAVARMIVDSHVHILPASMRDARDAARRLRIPGSTSATVAGA